MFFNYIFAVPNHADTRAALQFLRDDMLHLRDGFMAPHTRVDQSHAYYSLLRASSAALLADSPEASLCSLHGGHMCTLYCRKCVKRSDSAAEGSGTTTTFTLAVCDLRLQRRADQTHSMIRHMLTEANNQSESAKEKERQRMGLRTIEVERALARNPQLLESDYGFFGPDFDAHRQTPFELSHLFYYGVWSALTTVAYDSLNKFDQSVFYARFANCFTVTPAFAVGNLSRGPAVRYPRWTMGYRP